MCVLLFSSPCLFSPIHPKPCRACFQATNSKPFLSSLLPGLKLPATTSKAEKTSPSATAPNTAPSSKPVSANQNSSLAAKSTPVSFSLLSRTQSSLPRPHRQPTSHPLTPKTSSLGHQTPRPLLPHQLGRAQNSRHPALRPGHTQIRA